MSANRSELKQAIIAKARAAQGAWEGLSFSQKKNFVKAAIKEYEKDVVYKELFLTEKIELQENYKLFWYAFAIGLVGNLMANLLDRYLAAYGIIYDAIVILLLLALTALVYFWHKNRQESLLSEIMREMRE